MGKWGKYVIGALVVAGLIFLVNQIYQYYELKQAIKEAEQYVIDTYPEMNFEIEGISTVTFSFWNPTFKHYGYFKHAIHVRDVDNSNTFDVFYDKKMDWLEDSIHLDAQESWLQKEIEPKVKEYFLTRWEGVRYIDASYYLETAKPMIVVVFEQNAQQISETDFTDFVTYLKDTLGVNRANVILYYWEAELHFQEDY